MPLRPAFLFILLFTLLHLVGLSQKKKETVILEKINSHFSFQKKNKYSDKILVVNGVLTEISFTTFEQLIPDYIWLKTIEGYILVNSNADIVVGKDQKLSSIFKTNYTQKDTLNKNWWLNNDKGWRLFSKEGKILVTEFYKEITYLAKNWFIITDFSNAKKICDNNGKMMETSFTSYLPVSGTLPLIGIQNDGKWRVCNYESFEKSKVEFDSIYYNGNSYLEINKEWYIAQINATDFSTKQLPAGKLTVSTSSPYFFIEKNHTYYKYSPNDLSFTSIGKSYENIKNSYDNEYTYAQISNDWYLLFDTLEIKMYYSSKEINTLTGKTNLSKYNQAYDRPVISKNLNTLFTHGLMPFNAESFQLEPLEGTIYAPYISLITVIAGNQENMPKGIYDYLHNRFILNPIFSEIEVLPSGYVLLAYDNCMNNVSNYGVCDTSGKIIIPCNYLEITDHWFSNGLGRMFICKINSGIYDVYDCTGIKINQEPLLFYNDLSSDGFVTGRLKNKYYIQNNCIAAKQNCTGYEFEKIEKSYTTKKIIAADLIIKNTKLFENPDFTYMQLQLAK